MRKYFSLLGLSLLTVMFSFTACSDDDDVSAPSTPEEVEAVKTSPQAMSLLSLLSGVSDLNELPDNWADASFTVEPTVGYVLDEAQPHVRSLAVANLKEAIEVYNNLTGQKLDAATTANTWNLEGSGSVSYKAVSQSGLFATIDFSIRQLPHLSQLRLVPAAALGTNATFSGEPYYHLGDVVLDVKEGSYWICARPAYSPAGKGDSHWFSFQLTSDNYKTFKATTKRKETIVPTKLDKDTRMMKYLMNLLYVMANPNDCADLFQKGRVLEDGMGELGAGAYSVSMLQEIAQNWQSQNIWNHLPVTAGFFKQPNVNVLYYGYSSRLSSTVKLFCMRYSGDAYSTANEADYSWDMNTNQEFDAHVFAKDGGVSKSYKVGPDRAIIVRYKKQTDLMKGYKDPTKAMDPTQKVIKDVYRYAEHKAQQSLGRSFYPGDVIQDKNTGALYFCLQPAGSILGNPSTKALFLSLDPRALNISEDGLSLTNAIEEDYLPRVSFMLYELIKSGNKPPYELNNTLLDINTNSGMNPKYFLARRDTVVTDTNSNGKPVTSTAKAYCTNYVYKRKSDGKTAIMRLVFDLTKSSGIREDKNNHVYLHFYTKYIAGDKATIDLLDVKDQNKVNLYAKDRWSVLKFSNDDNNTPWHANATPWRTKTETLSPFNLKSYLWDIEKRNFANPTVFGMSNEPVLVMTMELIEDKQPLPERFRIYKPCNNQDNWDNAALAFASVYWYQTVYKDEMFFKDDVSFVPADLNF